MSQQAGHKICAVLLFFCSIVSLVPVHLRSLSIHRSIPFETHLASIVLGFLALYLSAQLLKRKRLAHTLALCSLLVLVVLDVLRGYHGWHVLLYILTLAVLAWFAGNFTVKSNNLNANRALQMSLLLFVGAIAYGAAGFYLINKRAFNVDFTLIQSLKYSFLQLVTFENAVISPASRYGHVFLLSLDLISGLMVLIIALNLFRPVKFALFADKSSRKEAHRIITSQSSSVEDFFKLWPQDKHYFFNKSRSAVLAYRVESGVALALDGPNGSEYASVKLLKDFIAFSNNNGWTVSVIHADAKTMEYGKQAGMLSIFIGNEALVDVAEFCRSTARNKHFRYVENKARQENLGVEWWEPPLNDEQVSSLRRVSDAWLSTPGKREYTFVMGYFDDSYIRSSEIAVLKHNESIIAYVNLIPSYLPTQRSIDHMRYIPTMPSIGMHYLLKNLIQSLHEKEVKVFNLGLSPLSGISDLSNPNAAERLLASLKTFGSRYYSFSGLEQFKSKFKPVWQPKYLMYQGSAATLLRISSAINKATTIPDKNRRKVKILISLSVAAGLGYMSFLLAYPLGIAHAGLASELGAKGAPYNWLFNGLDILAGLAILYLSHKVLNRAYSTFVRLMFCLFAVGGVGNILAALTPLHTAIGFDIFYADSQFLHVAFSTMSIIGFIGAAILYCLIASRYRMLAIFLLTALLISTMVSILFIHKPFDNQIQGLQLGLISLWIILIGFENVRVVPYQLRG